MPPKKSKLTYLEKERIAKDKKFDTLVGLSDGIVTYKHYAGPEYVKGAEVWGLTPSFLSLNDPRSARVQIDEHYRHGGGWRTFKGHKLNVTNDESKWHLTYPGDTPVHVQCVQFLVILYRAARERLFFLK